MRFGVVDAGARLPFEDGEFDALLCIDSMNHPPSRLDVLRDWRRVLRRGGRALFTDPVVATGPVANDDLPSVARLACSYSCPTGSTTG